jgi:hypothetical protein
MNKGDPPNAENQRYREDLEAMAELLLDIYLDKNNPQAESTDSALTRPSRGRKIRRPPGTETRRAERSPNNDSSPS